MESFFFFLLIVMPKGNGLDLPTEVAVVHVAHEEGLGCEGVWLHLHVRPSHLRTHKNTQQKLREVSIFIMASNQYLVHEGGLADVGVSTDDNGARRRIDGRQSGHVLPHLLEVRERCSAYTLGFKQGNGKACIGKALKRHTHSS
jgi:hypothetical protein